MNISNRILVKTFFLVLLISFTQQSFVVAATNETSFTPSIVKLPITAISLHDSTTGSTPPIYICDSSTEDCVVDLTDNTSISDKLTRTGGAQIPAGNYDRIKVQHCTIEGGYDIQVQGVMGIGVGPTTYYTTPNSDVISTVATDLGLATIPISGCESEYNLPQVVTVGDGSPVHINLLVNFNKRAYAALSLIGAPAWCIKNDGGTASLCLQPPHFIPILGNTFPSIETYYLANGAGIVSTAGGQIILFVDNGEVIGGFAQPLYAEGSIATILPFSAPLSIFSNNGDGTYTLQASGPYSTSYDFRIDNFQRATHTGTYYDSVFSYTYSIYLQ
ncbi:MAG: hypothetical protein OEY00_02450 [Gammaproteobacteria bacterium]|nr:hypothetical protein [Gammaproteobacteria bacterium]